MRRMLSVLLIAYGVCAANALAQTVIGSQFTPAPKDVFTDGSNTMSHYGLSWGEFSNGTIGPSAMLSGYGGINFYTTGVRRVTIGPWGAMRVGDSYSQNPSITIGGTDGNQASTGTYSLFFGAYRDVESIVSGIVAKPEWTCCGGYPSSGYAGIRLNSLGFYTAYNPADPNSRVPNLLIATSGNVGIGTSNPSYTLDVAGQIRASRGLVFPDGTTQNSAFDSTLCGGDYAESVDVSGDKKTYEPGDVLVIEPKAKGKFLKSDKPYSMAVAGIYSTKPGLVGRRQQGPKNPEEVPMAVVGIVPTKVSTENGPIEAGDVLVTSTTPGYAMKGTDRALLAGAIIGKAMDSLATGSGVIEVLVSLQ